MTRYHQAAYTLDSTDKIEDEAPLSAGHEVEDAEAVKEEHDAFRDGAEEQAKADAEKAQEWAERDPKPKPSELLAEQGREPAPDEQTSSSSGSESDSDCPPNGTTGEVLDWVGDDKARAQQALDAENARDTPRVTLVAELEKRAE